MSHEEREFQQLVERVRHGDQEAIRELISRYEEEVSLIARVRLGASLRPYVDAEDIMQSVHRSLLIGLRDDKIDLRSPKALIGLAAVMVRRKVARKWRRMRRQHRLSGAAGETQASDLPNVMASFGMNSQDPAKLAEIREQFNAILSRLDEADRELIRLRIDGYRTVDAAQILGISPDSARVRLSRLRKKLQEANLDDALL